MESRGDIPPAGWREVTSPQPVTLGGSARGGRTFAGSETDLNRRLAIY